MKRKKNSLITDTRGFSTAFDIFLFLILVSICAIILLPSITGNTQIKSTLESKSQKNSGDTLLTLLNGRVDEFEYIVAGSQMDAVAGPIRNTSVYIAGKKMIAGKELKHKTFSDIAAENAAAQWIIYYNGSRTQLNFGMDNYSVSSKTIMKNYLDKQIGDRYDYNFTVIWRPFTDVPVGGSVDIGEPVPDNAYVESAYVTMPYHIGLTRKQVEDIIDNTFIAGKYGNLSLTLEELKNDETTRNLIEEEINNLINDAMNDTIDDSVDIMVNQKLGPVLDEARNKMIEEVNNLLSGSEIMMTHEMNEGINESLDTIGADIAGTMSDKLKLYLKKVIKDEVHEVSDKEIEAFTTELADLYVNNAITVAQAKDRILTEIFSRININRAQATLSIWEKRK